MLKILGRDTSANVQKVLWLCEELGLAYQREDIGGPFGRNRDPEYLALNPNAVVPTLIDGDYVLWESNSIVRYLANVHDDGTLYPKDPKPRGWAERWMDWQLTVLGPAIFPVFFGLIRTPEAERNPQSIAAGRDRTAAAVGMLDGWLKDHAFVAGERFTIGDIPVGIFVYRWFTLPIEREDHPHLRRWYESFRTRPGFRKYIDKPLV